MTQAVIQRLRRLEGLAIITPGICIRAERYVLRHLEVFSAATNMTVSQAVDLALESAALTRKPTAGTEMRIVELQFPLDVRPAYSASIEIIETINWIDSRELVVKYSYSLAANRAEPPRPANIVHSRMHLQSRRLQKRRNSLTLAALAPFAAKSKVIQTRE